MSSNLSRRSFLKGAAALAVVSAASGVLAGCSATGSTSGVTGSGAARVFKDGENVITITSTDIDIVSKAGEGTMKVIPSFKVDNKTKTALVFKGSVNDITGYTVVVSASFDGKLPEAKPMDASYTIGSGSSAQSDSYIKGDLEDFYDTSAAANKVTEGGLVFEAPFKNWNSMVVTMTLYKKTDDGTAKVASTTFTFNQ